VLMTGLAHAGLPVSELPSGLSRRGTCSVGVAELGLRLSRA
jgi:hypothetical protein